MRSLAAVTAPAHAETVRRALVREGFLRGDLHVVHEGGEVAFPMSRLPSAPIPHARWEEREFGVRPGPGAESYRELVDVPPEIRENLPRSFDVVGDVVLIRLPEEVRAYATAVGEALLSFVPGARIVGSDRGVHGTARLRRIERLAGSGGWITVHHENHLSLEVDLERAYFSPRLAREHAAVADEVERGERVIDFACGVAPFGAHVVRDGRAREVVAVDANPDATALAHRNLERAGGGRAFRVVTALLESFAPSAGGCERAILNLPQGGVKYLAQVGATVERGGTLHYYERTGRSRFDDRPTELMKMLGDAVPGSWSVTDAHVVHPYSPTEDIVAYRLLRG